MQQNTPSFTSNSYGSMWLPLVMRQTAAPLYLSTDLGNGCWDTRALLQGNEGVHRLAGSECVLLGHLRPTVEWGTLGACPDTRYRQNFQSCKALFETLCIYIIFGHETLHVSDSSSVRNMHSFMQFHPGPARKLSTKLYDIYHRWVYSE